MVSPTTRFDALLWKRTYLPSGVIAREYAYPSHISPPELTLTLVVVLLTKSLTNTPQYQLLPEGVRLLAALSKRTYLPSGVIALGSDASSD